MKTKALIGLFCGAALATQAAQIGFGIDPSELNLTIWGHYITPTRDAQLFQLEQDVWWGSSDAAKEYAQGYAQALFNFAKYNDSRLVENPPLVYFAYAVTGDIWVDTWVYDIGRNKFYNEQNSIHSFLGLGPPPGGWHLDSVPDTASTAGLMVLALGGCAALRIRRAS